MPLFFIISGTLFSILKYNSFGNFIKRRGRGLILPYIYCSLIVLTGYTLLGKYHFIDQAYEVLTTGWKYALWFIPVLFCCELAYFTINRYLERYKILIIIILLATGRILSHYNIHAIYSLSFVPTAIFYYGVGDICTHKLKRNEFNMRWVIGALILSAIFSTTIFLSPCKVKYGANQLGDIWCFISSISGSIMMILCSIIAAKSINYRLKRIPIFLGQNSYALLAFHQLVVNAIVWATPLHGTLARIAMWIVLTIIILSTNRYLPSLFCKKKCNLRNIQVG